jgi:two-component system response regulator
MSVDNVEILHVEDDIHDVELTVMALRKEKLANTIHVVRDGAEALDFLFCRGQYAARDAILLKLVLLDMKLPKVTGLEVLKAIRADARTEAIPVVILTSSREQRDIMESYKLHVNSYIQKPVDLFQQIVRQLGLYWMVVNRTPENRDHDFSASTQCGKPEGLRVSR